MSEREAIMRTRPEIEKQNRNWLTSDMERLQIEIWLDIRDLLEELVRLQSSRDTVNARGGSGGEV
jgi:hypothetical protein